MFFLGILRGADLQAWGAVAVGISFFVIGLPTGAYLGLCTNMGLLGVWMGNVIGLTSSSLLLGLKVCRIHWHEMAGEQSNTCATLDTSRLSSLVDGNDYDKHVAAKV